MAKLSVTQKRWLLTLHLVFSAIMLGVTTVFLFLSILAANSNDESVIIACFTIMHKLANTSVRYSTIATLLTGILLSVLTQWGLFKFYWIIVKEALTLISILLGPIDNRTNQSDEIQLRGIRIDKISRKVFVNEEEVPLTSKEYDLLLFLASHPNRVFSKDELFEKIWGMDSLGDNATVTVYISKLREKVELTPSKPQYIETIWGVGYRFNV